MERMLGQISLLVRDYDEALYFYINVLGFEIVQDTVLTPAKRWVVIKPKNSSGQGCNLLLARAATPIRRISSETKPAEGFSYFSTRITYNGIMKCC